MRMTSEDIDRRMKIFFDLFDKRGNGMLSKNDVCKAIAVSASANQLDRVKSQAEYYAALIMEVLDSNNQGFIELRNLWQLVESLYRSRPIYKRTSTNLETYVEVQGSLPKRLGKPISTTKNYFQTCMNLMVPPCVYAYDRGLTFMDRTHSASIFEPGIIHQGNALVFDMAKPKRFKYKIGMYVLLKFPEISNSKWYPFSIVSAPNYHDIRVLMNNSMGQWTATLLEKMASEVALAADAPFINHKIGSRRVVFDIFDEPLYTIPYIIMKGPYGLPAHDYKKYDVVLVIESGVGAIPYLSILRDLINSLQNSRLQGIERKKRPHKSYFYWVASHQSSFDALKAVFEAGATYFSDNVIEMHNYLTSVYEEGDARSAMVQIVQSLQRAKTGVDVISGTRIKTHFGAPNWKDVFVQLALKHKSKNIGVYYSGSNEQMKLIRKLCQDFSYDNTTHFHFHFHNKCF